MARLHPLRISVFVLMTTVIWRPPAAEASPALPFGFQADATVEAVAAIDGDTLELSDGRLLRLAAIQAPKAPLGFDETKSWPLEDAGRAALGEFALGRRLSLVFTGPPRDRYGRLHAQVFDDEGGWIQAALLAAALPSPRRATPAQPSDYLNERVPVIRKRIDQLGPMLACAS